MSRHRAAEARRPLRSAAGRGICWLARAVAVIAVAVILAPVTLVAGGAFWYAWWRGAPPRRIYAAALWCLPMVAAWLVAVVGWPVPVAGARALPAGIGPGAWWFRVVAAPYRAWDAM